MVIRDPSSMSTAALGRMSSYQNDESYTIIDGRIFSRDGRNLLMFISPVHSSKETSENLRFINMLDGAIAEVIKDSDPEILIEYFGTVAVPCARNHQIGERCIHRCVLPPFPTLDYDIPPPIDGLKVLYISLHQRLKAIVIRMIGP